MKRTRLLAIVGAGVLAMGVVGVALATELNSGQVDQALSTFDQDCSDFEELGLEIGAGEIGVHFILTDPEASSGTLDAVFSTDSVSDVANTVHGNSAVLHFYVVITGDLDTTITSASTDVDGKNLNVSHVCAGEETTTSFTSSEESTTDSSTSSEETTTSFSSSEESTTDSESSSTSFSDSVSDSTTQPPTDTIGETGSGQQSGGLWLLLAVLGALAGSVIVLAPSKAKTRD